MEELLSLCPQHVAAAYALNPLTIATCVAMSTAVFHNFILSLVLLFILRGKLIHFFLLCICDIGLVSTPMMGTRLYHL